MKLAGAEITPRPVDGILTPRGAIPPPKPLMPPAAYETVGGIFARVGIVWLAGMPPPVNCCWNSDVLRSVGCAVPVLSQVFATILASYHAALQLNVYPDKALLPR